MAWNNLLLKQIISPGVSLPFIPSFVAFVPVMPAATAVMFCQVAVGR